jgi:hypothetical protein
MRKHLFFIYTLFFIGVYQFSNAQINVKVKVNSVSVSSALDCDAGGSDNSDYVFEYKVQDNSPSAFSNNTPVAGSIGMCNYVVVNEQNGPYTLTPSSPGAALFSPSSGLFFDRNYNCKNEVPSSLTLTWSAYENDDAVVPSITPVANGTIAPQIITYTVPTANGTFTAQYTQTSIDGACPQTYIIEFEVEKTVGTFTPLNINFLDGNIICTGTSNGDLEASYVGGSGTVLVDWSVDGLGDYNDNANITGVIAGTYTIVVKDALNCTDTGIVVINEVDPPLNITSFTAGSTTVCAGQMGVTYAVATQTNAVFFWSYAGGVATINGTGNNIDIDFGNAPATGTISVYAQNSCSTTPVLTATIDVLATPTILISGNNTMCDNSQEVLTASGATTYTWNSGATTSSVVVSPTVATVYTVTGTNANGCSSIKQFSMGVIPSPTVQINGSTLTVCPNQTIAVSAVGNGNLYIWSDGFIGANHTISASATSVYTVTNTYTNSCFAQTTFTLNVSGADLSVVGSQTVCTAGVVSLTVTGAPTYSWSNGVSTSTNTFVPNNTTTVSVLGIDGAGCRDSLTLNIYVVNPPTVTITGLDSICEGQSVVLTANGSNDVIGYAWNSGNITSTISVTPLATFTYVASVSNGVCTVSNNHEVYVRLIPTADFITPNPPLCTTDGLYTFTATPSGGNYSGTSVTGSLFDPSIGTGIYPVTYSVNVGNGCIASVTNSVEVMVCTGLSNLNNTTGFSLYPNPTASDVFLKSDKEITSVLIYDYSGKLVRMIEVNAFETKVDLSDLAKGFYSFNISMNDRSQTTMKVVKD